MNTTSFVTFEFVEFIPDDLKDGKVYISMPFATAVHKCCCGCGNKVVTPFSPTDWKLIFDGKTISLYPSIGNWGFECKSHYWIWESKIRWSVKMSQKKIDAGRTHDRSAKQKYFNKTNNPKSDVETEPLEANENNLRKKLKEWWS